MERKITVCTPTYNRAKLLDRPYNSLKSQTCKNFTWLIIDDGSTDNTEEVVNKFINEADFDIEYCKKDNGGRHTALNFSYQKIKTEYVINLDSDDEYLPTTIETLYRLIEQIPKDEYERFWQISGRCIDSKTQKLVGEPFKENVNNLSGVKQRKSIAKSVGEKSNCRKIEILKKYPFPIYDDTKFVVESTVWKKINLKYDTYCTNDILRVFFQDSPDSLAKGRLHTKTKNRTVYHYSIFCINELFSELTYDKSVRLAIVNVARRAMLSNIKYIEVMKDINKWYKRILVTIIGYPISYIYMKIKKEKHDMKK